MRGRTSVSRSLRPSALSSEPVGELDKRRRIFSNAPPQIDTMGGCYMPIPHEVLDKILDLLVARFGNRGVFVDAGSGDNRVLAAAFSHGFRRCVGIELDPVVFEMGKRRLLQFFDGRIPFGIRTVHGDFTHAESYGPDLRTVGVIYHFINRKPLAELVKFIEDNDLHTRLLLVDFSGQEKFDRFDAVFRATIEHEGKTYYGTVYQRVD